MKKNWEEIHWLAVPWIALHCFSPGYTLKCVLLCWPNTIVWNPLGPINAFNTNATSTVLDVNKHFDHLREDLSSLRLKLKKKMSFLRKWYITDFASLAVPVTFPKNKIELPSGSTGTEAGGVNNQRNYFDSRQENGY